MNWEGQWTNLPRARWLHSEKEENIPIVYGTSAHALNTS